MTAMWTDQLPGPASYATGGFVVTTGLASVASFDVAVGTGGASLASPLFDVALDTPAPGQVTVKVLRQAYDRLTALGAVSGLPAGVMVRGTSGGSTVAVNHSHTIDHVHSGSTSGPSNTGIGATAAAGPNESAHTHTLAFGLPAGTLSSIEAAHAHLWNSLYSHGHTTNIATDLALVELTAATNLSTTTFDYMALDA